MMSNVKQIYEKKSSTKIWSEVPDENNPYVAKESRLHGYDMTEIIKKVSYVDTLFLLFTGDLPSKENSQLLEKLMVCLINPGPRHNATRAAMNAGIGKTDHIHILPIGLIAMGGQSSGATEVELSMGFLIKNINKNAEILAGELEASAELPQNGGNKIFPGFGSRYNSQDTFPNFMAKKLEVLPAAGKALKWGKLFVSGFTNNNQGWLMTGVAAATLHDLGFAPREGACLFQLMCAPGLLAHGLEQTHKPITAMPMLADENYVIEK